MFTGIIEELGTVKGIKKGGKSCTLNIKCNHILEDVSVGDSIATNGVCLTVTSFGRDSFTADVMPETMNRSSLGNLKINDYVNLERAMQANGRFGGHIVSGHIDGTGKIVQIRKEDNAVWFGIQAGNELLRYIIFKGSIAIDGISLTVAKVEKDRFFVSIIPHSMANTTLSKRKIGDIVNLECDVVGKYVEKLESNPEKKESKITRNFLLENGF